MVMIEFPTLAAWSTKFTLLETLGITWKIGLPIVGQPGKTLSPFSMAGPGQSRRPDAGPCYLSRDDSRTVPRLDSRYRGAAGCFPLEYVAAALVVVLSGLMGRRLSIRPKRYDDWSVVPNLWGAIVGPPGFLKTPAVEAVLRPLKRLVADALSAPPTSSHGTLSVSLSPRLDARPPRKP